jgi:ketosteroid isomerase-like protein
MSEENVEIVWGVWGVIDGRRVDVTEPDVPEGFVERLDPEVEFEEDPSFPEAGVYRGRSEVLRYFKNFTAQFEQFVFEVEDVMVVGGDGVLFCFRQTGRGKGSGAEFDFQSAWLFTVRDDRVVRIRSYLDRKEALEAAEPGE